MKSLGLEFRVGLVVLAATSLLMLLTTKVGNIPFFSNEKGYVVHFMFDSASGLDNKSPIMIAGVSIGKVTSISLDDGMAHITGRIKPEMKVRATGTTATIKSKGVLGEKFIELTQGSGNDFVKAGDYITQSQAAEDLDTLIATFTTVGKEMNDITSSIKDTLKNQNGDNSLKTIVENVTRTTENLNKLIDENMLAVNRTTRNLEIFSSTLNSATPAILTKFDNIASTIKKLTDAIEAGKGTVGKLVSTDELYQNLEKLIATLNTVASKIDSGQGTISKLINDDKLYTNIDDSMSNINKITAKLDNGKGTVGKLLTDEKLYNDISTAIGTLGNAVDKLDKIKLIVHLSNEFQLDESENKGYFTVDIIPSSSKFYRFIIVDDPRGHITKQVDRVTVNGVETITEKVVTKSKFKISALIGKRFGDFRVRAGMMENSFGIGGDYFLVEDKLQLSLDAWDFSSEDIEANSAHVKSKLTYLANNNLKLNLGYDNFTNRKIDTMFFGGEFFFRDDDLKYLIQALR